MHGGTAGTVRPSAEAAAASVGYCWLAVWVFFALAGNDARPALLLATSHSGRAMWLMDAMIYYHSPLLAEQMAADALAAARARLSAAHAAAETAAAAARDAPQLEPLPRDVRLAPPGFVGPALAAPPPPVRVRLAVSVARPASSEVDRRWESSCSCSRGVEVPVILWWSVAPPSALRQ